MAHIDRFGVEIYYEANGNGPPVLLSHGYSATSEMWKGQIPVLSPSHQVVAWDMRGHGLSASPDDPGAYSEAATVDDMAAVLDARGIEDAVIGGLSLGGYMSLAFHLKYPERVRALMLFDTGPGYKNPDSRKAWNETAETWAVGFESKGLDALSERGGREMKTSTHRSAQGLAHAARGMLRQFDSRVMESLPSIEIPTLVLVGDKDEAFIAPTNYMAKKIPGAQKVVIPDAGHSANMDQPEAFNKAVMSFLDGLK